MTSTLYLDQNYLSGIAKRKPGFVALEPALRTAVALRAVIVAESAVHEIESRPRPDLRLLELLRELSAGYWLPRDPDRTVREVRRRMSWTIGQELPERRSRASDAADLEALASAVVHCDLVTCDAFMADVIRRARLDLRHSCELFTGRRADVVRLKQELERLSSAVSERHRRQGLSLARAESSSPVVLCSGSSRGRRPRRERQLTLDTGQPISYEVLEPGTPVYSSDGTQIGTVAHVLAVEDEDVFDGVVIAEHRRPSGHRFADADDVDRIYERAVMLKLDHDAAGRLPEPTANPAVMRDDPGQRPSGALADKLRRAWDYISGNY